LGYKRQWIIETAPEKYIFLMDDDCTFSTRKNGRLIKAKKSDTWKMFSILIKWIKNEQLGQVGISFRSLNFTIEEEYKEVQNVYSIWCIDRELFNKLSLKCDHARSLSDMQITLGLLSSGFKNRITYKYAIHQTPGTGGGCSEYRDAEEQKQSVIAVNKVFPHFTTVIKRKDKKRFGWYDLKVNWKEAYKYGEIKRRSKTGLTDLL
jgi:hypothetical protein